MLMAWPSPVRLTAIILVSSTGNDKAEEVGENAIGVAQCAFKTALTPAGHSFHRTLIFTGRT